MKTLQIFFVVLFLSATGLAQTGGGNFLQFKGRIGFDDEKEHLEARYFSADETQVTLIGLKTIQTWDIPTAKLIESHPHEIEMLDEFKGMAYEFSPDGSKVVTLDSLGGDGTKKEDRVNAYAYNVKTGKRIATLERPDYSVRIGRWTADGETFVTFSAFFGFQAQTEISFWNGKDLSFRNSVVVEGYSWYSIAPDGKRIYVGNGGYSKVFGLRVNFANKGDIIRAYDLQTGELVKSFDDSGASFEVERGYTFLSPDGRFISTAKDKNTLVWDTQEGDSKPLYELTAPNGKNRMRPEGFSDDGEYLFIRQDGKNEFYDPATGKLAADVPQLVWLRRENEYFVRARYNIYNFLIQPGYIRKDSVQVTPDGRYAVITPCEKATVLDLTTNQKVFAVDSGCDYDSSKYNNDYDRISKTYYYSKDVFRLSPRGKLLINFRATQFVVRDLKTGAVLQQIKRADDKNLQNVPKWNMEWDFKGDSALTIAEGNRLMLIWEINEN